MRDTRPPRPRLSVARWTPEPGTNRRLHHRRAHFGGRTLTVNEARPRRRGRVDTAVAAAVAAIPAPGAHEPRGTSCQLSCICHWQLTRPTTATRTDNDFRSSVARFAVSLGFPGAYGPGTVTAVKVPQRSFRRALSARLRRRVRLDASTAAPPKPQAHAKAPGRRDDIGTPRRRLVIRGGASSFPLRRNRAPRRCAPLWIPEIPERQFRLRPVAGTRTSRPTPSRRVRPLSEEFHCTEWSFSASADTTSSCAP